jgi:hypothetical protein
VNILTQEGRNQLADLVVINRDALRTTRVSQADLADLSVRAMLWALELIWLSEYADWRGAGNHGDHGHDSAEAAADIMVKRIRKAVGFAYP